jgi:hypothetical protein
MTHPRETPKQAAKRLAAGAIRDGFKPEALHAYTSTDGEPLYWRIRAKNPQTGEKWIRPMKVNGEGFTLGEPTFPDGKPLYRLPELTSRVSDMVVITEGEWCADALGKLGMLTTTSGAADSAVNTDWKPLAQRPVLIWPDHDDAGSRYAETVKEKLKGFGCAVNVIDVDKLDLPPKGDAVDWLAKHADAAPADVLALPCLSDSSWGTPIPLPEGLPPVAAFDYEMLPTVLCDFVHDIAERMQCPSDFPAVAAIICLASVVGRRVGIAPKRHDDWTVIPNLWGMVIGRPGLMKSPPLAEVMRPLQKLQAQSIENHNDEMIDHKAGLLIQGESEKVAKAAIAKALKASHTVKAREIAEGIAREEATEPHCRRYIVNDTTVEKLGELLNENPNGLLLFRDELTGFFRSLEKQGREADRAFYLECWNGDGSYTYDRIGRGTQHITGACLSILGSIQPGPLSDLVRGLRGSGDDGLLQRFQIAVWPDASREWVNVDRSPNRQSRDDIDRLVSKLDELNAERAGADSGSVPILRFDDEAQILFDTWREALEIRLRGDTEHAVIEAHLAKYRSLVPSLALIFHFAEGGDGAIQSLPLERSIAWAEYLESHARRIYAPAISPDLDAAKLLGKKIMAGAVTNPFALRDVYRANWSGLTTRNDVTAAVAVLEDHNWLRDITEPTTGRPRTLWTLNPHLPIKVDP